MKRWQSVPFSDISGSLEIYRNGQFSHPWEKFGSELASHHGERRPTRVRVKQVYSL